jgi:hypothetical protein
MMGEIQHKLRERVNEVMPRDSYLEFRGKVERASVAMAEDGSTIGLLLDLVDALLESVDVLAAEVDKLTGD